MNIKLSSLNNDDFKLYLIIVVSMIIINIVINVSLYYKLKDKIYIYLSYIISLTIVILGLIGYLSIISNYDKVKINGEYEIDHKAEMMRIEGENYKREKVYLKTPSKEYIAITLKQKEYAKIGDKIEIKMDHYRLVKKDRFEVLLNGEEGQLPLNYQIRKSGK